MSPDPSLPWWTSQNRLPKKNGQNTSSSTDEIYRDLCIILRYVDVGCNLFGRLVGFLETINFVPLLERNQLNEYELRRLILMIGAGLRSLRLQKSDIPTLYRTCKRFRVKLMRTNCCFLLAGGESGDKRLFKMLGHLLPNLEVLHAFCCIEGKWPIMKKVHTIYLGSASQVALEEVFMKNPQLTYFVLNEESEAKTQLNIKKINRCQRMTKVQLPLQLNSLLSICPLKNLTDLSLQSQKLWPAMDWLPNVVAIIGAKRFVLESLAFDGSWLVAPLNLSLLRLDQCTALKEVRLSNCKVSETVTPALSFSCQKVSFRRCTLPKLISHLKSHQMLRQLQLFDCQVQINGPLLKRILDLRKCQPVLGPLILEFSQSTKLRSEFTKWSKVELKSIKSHLEVKEIDPHQTENWKQPIGMISMKFGKPINHLPDLTHAVEAIPNAADLVKKMNEWNN